ncbi:MAG: MBG domain-containing protein, partial [Planctomycetota bacterium]|nr:MBG domain-containing protein [Planctomycetota bacterium]
SIVASGTNTNYQIVLVDGTIAVTKAPLTITADAKSKRYGAILPQLSTTLTGLVNGDNNANIAGLAATTTASASSIVGNYAIIASGTNTNYTITKVDGTIEITRVPLTISADNKGKVYGATLPTLSTTLTGLVNGDTSANITGLAASTTATASSPVANFAITATGTNSNYSVTLVDGALAITKAALTLTAANKSYIRGIEPVPAFTYTYSGFVNGDTKNLLIGAPTLTTPAKTYGPFGTYPISVDVSTVTNPNYTLAGINGTLTLNKVSPTIIPIDSIPILTTTNGAANGITIWGSAGKKLGTINPYPGYTGRIVTALGDLNGDGVPDIITGVGAGAAPLLRRFDGRTLKEIGQGFYAYDKGFLGGMSVAAADVDGDGLCEIITGTGNGSAPHVKVLSATGTIKASFFAYASNFIRGVNLITGDINGDGKAEIVTTPNAGGGPHTKVFDGTGKASASFFAYESTFTGGFSLALADTDGNGTKEIITMSYAGRKTAGRVFDPKGVMLKEWFPNGSVTSGAMVVAGDLTGDKVDEIVTVPLLGTPATMKVFDGGLKLGGSVSPYATNFAGGVSLRLVDTNGDGIKEIVTAPGKGMAPQVKRWDGKLKLLDSLFATTSSFTGGVWLD